MINADKRKRKKILCFFLRKIHENGKSFFFFLQLPVTLSITLTWNPEKYAGKMISSELIISKFLSFSITDVWAYARHVEHWNVPKIALFKQLLRPSRGLMGTTQN